jgi:hypothetical protein
MDEGACVCIARLREARALPTHAAMSKSRILVLVIALATAATGCKALGGGGGSGGGVQQRRRGAGQAPRKPAQPPQSTNGGEP